MAMLDINQYEFMMSNRCNFKDWRIVDLDNFMKGNPPYSDFLDQVTFERDLEKYEDGKHILTGHDIRTDEGMG